MRKIEVIEKFVCDTEEEAKTEMENIRSNHDGFDIKSMGYTYRTKKKKGEVIDEAYVLKVQKVYGPIFEIEE